MKITDELKQVNEWLKAEDTIKRMKEADVSVILATSEHAVLRDGGRVSALTKTNMIGSYPGELAAICSIIQNCFEAVQDDDSKELMKMAILTTVYRYFEMSVEKADPKE